MWLEPWPLCVLDDDNGDAPSRKILLIAQVLVRRDENVESGRFCSGQQFAVSEGSQPSWLAVRTVWLGRNRAIGTGVP